MWSPRLRARDATRQQFIIDLLDVWIPATNLGFVNLNEGIVGIFGYVLRALTPSFGRRLTPQ